MKTIFVTNNKIVPVLALSLLNSTSNNPIQA